MRHNIRAEHVREGDRIHYHGAISQVVGVEFKGVDMLEITHGLGYRQRTTAVWRDATIEVER